MPPTPREIDWSLAEALASGDDVRSLSALARRMGVNERTFRGRLSQEPGRRAVIMARLNDQVATSNGDDAQRIEGEDGSVTLISTARPAEETPWTPEELLELHGMEPAEWRVKQARPNAWNAMTSDKATGDNRIVTMHQLRLEVVPVSLLLQVPDPNDWTPPPKPRPQRTNGGPRKTFVISDHHAPHHDKTFHALVLDYLADEQPDEIDLNGDLGDFATISRHRPREGYAAAVNECLRAMFGILRDYRHVCPNARIRFKRGNHDERLQYMIIDNARELHRITPADDEIPALDFRRLLHLDELGVEYIDEEWDRAKTKLSPKLHARHGFSTAKNAPDVMLSKLAGSTVQGHTHRASITLRTEHDTEDVEEPITVRMAMQGGCACEIPGGLGYIPGGEPDWQNACALFTIYSDGDFHASLGIYVPGRFLAPNGKRYVA